MDVSADMLARARKNTTRWADRVQLMEQPYGTSALPETDFDAILFSYSLTMINPQWEHLLRHAVGDLRAGGVVAVADFHDSPFKWFKAHMGNNHVRMDAHLLPVLQQVFNTQQAKVLPAYGGVWQYLIYIGAKPTSS